MEVRRIDLDKQRTQLPHRVARDEGSVPEEVAQLRRPAPGDANYLRTSSLPARCGSLRFAAQLRVPDRDASPTSGFGDRDVGFWQPCWSLHPGPGSADRWRRAAPLWWIRPAAKPAARLIGARCRPRRCRDGTPLRASGDSRESGCTRCGWRPACEVQRWPGSSQQAQARQGLPSRRVPRQRRRATAAGE